MFMFWSKRTLLTRRLLKAKVRGEHETECETQENHFIPYSNSTEARSPCTNDETGAGCYSCCGGAGAAGADGIEAEHNNRQNQAKRSRQVFCNTVVGDEATSVGRTVKCKELLKSLKENQLEMLLTAVESYGADLGSCVLVPRCGRSRTTEECNSVTPRCYNSSHHNLNHNHHHHHHNHHVRRQRQADLHEQRKRDSEDAGGMLPLEERITAVTTTATTTTRLSGRGDRQRSRTSVSSENEFPVDPHVLCCQIWRWPDLSNGSELKRLPVCHSAKDPVYVCCNPYHWSRLCKPESPPPPYCLIADRLRPEDRAPSEGDDAQHLYRNTNSPPLAGSLTTNGEDATGKKEWCTLAYWELGGRVGRLYPVEPSTVNVFDSLLDGDGLCLATLAKHHSATSPAIQRTRSKIGLGLMLSQEADGVWAYNRSENPIFVNSPTLDDPESRTLLVYRVPPGFCLNIFARAQTMQQQHHDEQQACCPPGAQSFASGPVDVNSVRISFAKGWGPKYSRQEVTSCPCWLEVLLAPCR